MRIDIFEILLKIGVVLLLFSVVALLWIAFYTVLTEGISP